MPVQGFTRFRKLQTGYQGSNSSVLLTAATATRVLPLRGAPDVNLNWTYADIDQGNLFKVQAPYKTALDATQTARGPLTYNDFPYYASATLESGITPTGGGAAKTWLHQPAGTGSPEPIGYFTNQWGDDVGDPAGETPADWFQFLGGIGSRLVLTGPQNMGPVEVEQTWRYSDARNSGSTDHPVSGTVPTAGLSVDANPTFVMLADMELFLNDTSGAIGTTKISNAVHALTLTIENDLDPKYFANGSNTRFLVQDWGRGEMRITFEATYAKTSATVGLLSETDKWTDDDAQNRYAELRFTAPALAQAGIPYSLSIRMALRNVTRREGEIGGNTVVIITGDGFYDSGLGYAIRASCTNTLTAL